MCRYPNLETAKDICRHLDLDYTYERTKKHFKFYVKDRTIIISLKKANPDRVRKDIRRVANV